MEANTFSPAQRRRISHLQMKNILIFVIMKTNCQYLEGNPMAFNKVSKPLIEKRRRARINRSLSQLVEIVAKPSKLQENRAVRFEKAYILEMTVDYVKKIRDLRLSLDQMSSMNGQNYLEPENPFHIGYRRCMSEVKKFIDEKLQSQSREFPIASLQMHLNKVLHSPSSSSESNASPENANADLAQYQKSSKFRNYRANKRTYNCKSDSDSTISSRYPPTGQENFPTSFLSSTEDESGSYTSESDTNIDDSKLLSNNQNGRNSKDLNLPTYSSMGKMVWRPW